MGLLITMEEPTAAMRREAASAGFYQCVAWNTKHPKIQLLTVDELLEGKKIDMPPSRDLRTFKNAPKAKRTPKGGGGTLLLSETSGYAMPNTFQGNPTAAAEARFAIVVSRFNESITSRLLEGAVQTLVAHGVADERIDVAWTPGAFEIPTVANRLAASGRYAAMICLGPSFAAKPRTTSTSTAP